LGKDGKVNFAVKTLTTGYWPSYPKDTIKLPSQMLSYVDSFSEYYGSKTENRQLTWVHSLGTLALQGNFDKRPLDLHVTTTQAAILLLFNERDTYEIKEMMSILGIDAPTIKNNLRTLVSGRVKVLLKNPAKGYDISHRIKVNRKFVSPSRLVRVPNAITKTSNVERKKAQEDVQEDRKHAVEASIVRIMKARKTLTHTQLMNEVADQLTKRFKPDRKQIKLRIADLISREYLCRDEENSQVYKYLA
jgi:cullin 1